MYHDERGLIGESYMSINRMLMLFDETSDDTRQQQQCFQTITEDIPRLWHERYCHLNHRGIRGGFAGPPPPLPPPTCGSANFF